MSESINSRFSALINEFYNGNKRAFANAVGVSPTVIENVVGVRQGKPSYEVIDKMCANANVSPEWLLTGNGPMLREPVVQRAGLDVKGEFPLLRTDRTVERQTVPLYPIEATAGAIAVFEDVKPAPIDYLDLPDLPPVDGAVYVRGDSMYPLLKSGDIVLYKRVHDLQYGIFWGEMYLISALIDGDVYTTIKYVHKSDSDGCVKLVSHNPHHEPKDIPREMIRAMAIVKVSVRYNTIG